MAKTFGHMPGYFELITKRKTKSHSLQATMRWAMAGHM